MKTVSIRDAKNRLTELARQLEGGETIVVTRNGKPAFDLVPHRERGGTDFAALAAFRVRTGIVTIDVPDDFDEPFPEDFLITPTPEA